MAAKESSRGLAVVTGASRGLGKAIAMRLGQLGYNLLLMSRPSSDFEHAAREIASSTGVTVEIGHADLLDEAACVSCVANRQVDVLVNCGIYQGPAMNGRIDQISVEELRRAFQGNVLTQVALVKAVLPGMLRRKHGRVFQLVSSSSRIRPTRAIDKGGFQAFGYTAPKTAIAKLVPLLALEYAEVPDIRMFNIDPGLVITDKMRTDGTADRFQKYGTASPETTAFVIGELCTSDHPDLIKSFHGAEFVDAPLVYKEIKSLANL